MVKGRRVFLDFRGDPARRRPPRAVRAVAARARGLRLSRTVGRPDGDAHRPAQENERARRRALQVPRHRPRPRAARDRRLRPAQQRRLPRLDLVGIERARPLPRRRALRHPWRHAARRLGAQRRAGRERPGGALHRPPARRTPARRGRVRPRVEGHRSREAGPGLLHARPQEKRRPGAGGLHRRGAAEDVRLRRDRQGPGHGPRRKGPGPGAVARGAARAFASLRPATCRSVSRPSTSP